jgi:hypothetical protein
MLDGRGFVVRLPAGQQIFLSFKIVKTGSQANPLSYEKCTGGMFSRVKVARGFKIAIICT